MSDNSTIEPITVRLAVANKLTSLGETKLPELIRDGKLKSTTIGRTRLIDYASLKALALTDAA
jgi:excisionase family DNA binding protein